MDVVHKNGSNDGDVMWDGEWDGMAWMESRTNFFVVSHVWADIYFSGGHGRMISIVRFATVTILFIVCTMQISKFEYLKDLISANVHYNKFPREQISGSLRDEKWREDENNHWMEELFGLILLCQEMSSTSSELKQVIILKITFN